MLLICWLCSHWGFVILAKKKSYIRDKYETLCCQASLQTFYELSLLRLFAVKQVGCKERTLNLKGIFNIDNTWQPREFCQSNTWCHDHCCCCAASNICSGWEKELKWRRTSSLTLAGLTWPAGSAAGGECTYTGSSVKLFNQWKFSLVLDAKNRWHFIFPIGNTTQKCIFHYFFQHLLQILQGKILFHRDCSRDAPFT